MARRSMFPLLPSRIRVVELEIPHSADQLDRRRLAGPTSLRRRLDPLELDWVPGVGARATGAPALASRLPGDGARAAAGAYTAWGSPSPSPWAGVGRAGDSVLGVKLGGGRGRKTLGREMRLWGKYLVTVEWVLLVILE
jgi:hypothetical protein